MIYENVKRIAESRKLPISQVEKKAQLGNGTIGGWRKSKPSVVNVQKVARALGVSIEELLEGDKKDDSNTVSN